MTIVLAALATFFACVAAFCAVVWPIGAVRATARYVLRGEDRNVSGVPVIGTLAGCVAILLMPIGSVHRRLFWLWIPIVIEALVVATCHAHWRRSGLAAKQERLRRASRSEAVRAR